MDYTKNFTINNLVREFGPQDTNRGAHMAYILCVKFWIFI
jgi:hypothetical protein